MKRILIVLLLLIVFPTQAQNDDTATYELGTGTTIDYPAEWETELLDGVLSFLDGAQSPGLVLDYPIVYTLSEEQANISSIDAVAVVTNLLLNIEIDRRDIYEFKMGVRNVVAYDFRGGLSGSIFAVEFSNGAMGVLVTIDVDEDIENAMLSSFDSNEEIVTNARQSTNRNPAERDVPTILIFGNERRVVVPPGWDVSVRQEDDIQYMILNLTDNDLLIQLFDLSETITSGTELGEVLDSIDIDWEAVFGFEIDSGANDYYFGDREAISYELRIDDAEGTLVVLRFSDDTIGIATITGRNMSDYDMEINQIIGSYNNFGAAASLMQ